MKKILKATFCVVLISVSSLNLPVSASDTAHDDKDYPNNISENKYYYQDFNTLSLSKHEYNYNGVNIITDVEKTEAELKKLYDLAFFKRKL